MWPYKSRYSRFEGDIDEVAPSALGETDFSVNQTPIKLWLPEKLLNALDVLCSHYDATRPDVLRALFFEHAFGSVELVHLDRRARKAREDAEKSRIMFSPPRIKAEDKTTARAVNQQFLGKATEDIKLFLPAPLKIELEALAVGSGKRLSDYLRGVLARVLLGKRLFQAWQQALAQANAEARRHEESTGSIFSYHVVLREK